MDYNNIATKIRKNILEMHHISQESHVGAAFSCVDILTVLYFKILNIDPKNPKLKNRDRFILSKGHAAAALYSILAQRGFFPEKVLKTFCLGGGLPGHTTKNCVPGIETSAGSLGHGLPIGAGMALAEKGSNKKYRIFVLMGDGECDEGSVWEAALFSSHHKLDNLTVIIDRNNLQGLGKTNEVLNLEPLKEKWTAFGWQAVEIDGHNFDEIEKTLNSIPFKKNKPSVVICNTVKGKGVSFMEDKLEWHYKSTTEEQYNLALKDLNKK